MDEVGQECDLVLAELVVEAAELNGELPEAVRGAPMQMGGTFMR
jgi:hypothetical protein